MTVETLRMMERIVIACGGILSIWLGYKLFLIANIGSQSGGSFKSSLFNMSLTKVGPGVFFALFGAYVLGTGLKAPIQTQEHAGNGPGVELRVQNNAGIKQLREEIDKLPDGPGKEKLKLLADQIQREGGSRTREFIGEFNPDKLPPDVRKLLRGKGEPS